jgi:hypothetical protein
MRDYVVWHEQYDDPASGLSWRLRNVQAAVSEFLDSHRGPVRVVSACAGDGRDLIGVLGARADADRVQATLVEVHPTLVAAARAAAATAGLTGVQVRATDAGSTDAYVDAVPADLVLLVGIFGNIGAVDIERTITGLPQLCAAGATVIWSRAPGEAGNDEVRGWFAAHGCNELDYAEGLFGDAVGPGRVRFTGDPVALQPRQRLFTFVR